MINFPNRKKAKFGTVNIKMKLYPNSNQLHLLSKYFGCSRYIYNWAINYNQELYKKEKRSLDYCKLANLLKNFKNQKETSFLKEVDSTSLQQSVKDYYQSFTMFLMRKGGYPSYRKKFVNDTFRILNVNNSVRIDSDKIRLGKFGWVRTKPMQTIPTGSIQSVTVKRTKTGKVFATVSIRKDQPVEKFVKTGKEVGIDIGIKNFATFSDGAVIEKPDFFLLDDKKIKKLHRELSRKQKGSKNKAKAKLKLASAYEKDRNRREDFLNKLSLSIVKEYDLIAVEHLNIKEMLKDKRYKRLHRLIQNLGWYSFLTKVQYKANWYGKSFVSVDTYFPSSQTCSECGYQNVNVKDLSLRTWECPNCKAIHDRDANASLNILNEGKRILSQGV